MLEFMEQKEVIKDTYNIGAGKEIILYLSTTSPTAHVKTFTERFETSKFHKRIIFFTLCLPVFVLA